MKRILFIVMGALVILLSALSQPANAKSTCTDRPNIVEKLHDNYHETATATGLSKNGGVYEVFTSPEGIWTILFTRPDGISCMMAVGDNWENQAPELAGQKS